MLHRVSIDNKIAKLLTGKEEGEGAEKAAQSAVFWLIMLMVLVAAFEALALTTVTEPLNAALAEIWLYVPRILGGAIIILVAWIVATIVRTLLTRGLDIAKLDERVGGGRRRGLLSRHLCIAS